VNNIDNGGKMLILKPRQVLNMLINPFDNFDRLFSN